MNMKALEASYAELRKLAAPNDAEGIKKNSTVLLLWFLRNVLGIDDLEAYEYLCDGDNDQGIDGMRLEALEAEDGKTREVLTLFQSHFPEKPTKVGKNKVSQFLGDVGVLQSSKSVSKLLKGKLEPELKNLIERYDLVGRLDQGLSVRLVFLTAGALDGQAQKVLEAANHKHGEDYLTCYDLPRLSPILRALTSIDTVKAVVDVPCPEGDRFIATIGDKAIAVCAVRACDIVTWPGIADRSLFDLNLRRQLPPNRVRKELEHAIGRRSDHPRFLAYHNGLTVICRDIHSESGSLKITDLSVVNGTQSVIAFFDKQEELNDDLRVVVKFVQADPQGTVAREVSRRSNTQTPVNARNLRALDAIQLRLGREFETSYPQVQYETRPDYSAASEKLILPNDKAAQLLCAVFTQAPWEAVKRLSLFEAEYYPRVFTKDITAHHVMFVFMIHDAVLRMRASFPELYRKAWQLTALVATFLVGQLLRSEDRHRAVLENPKTAVKNQVKAKETLDLLARHAAGSLTKRRTEHETKQMADDFKVDFKRQDALKELAVEAVAQYKYWKTVEGK